MIVIGICGGIGTGKTTIANICKKSGYPIFYSDAAVAKAYEQPSIISAVAKIAPQSIIGGAVSKESLSATAVKDPAFLPKLEAIIHPVICKEAAAFISKHKAEGASLVFIEAPLMFTSNMHTLCDYTITLTTSKKIQKARVLQRKGMTAEKFETLYARQQKEMALCKQKADFIICTNGDILTTKQRLKQILCQIASSLESTNGLGQKQKGE